MCRNVGRVSAHDQSSIQLAACGLFSFLATALRGLGVCPRASWTWLWITACETPRSGSRPAFRHIARQTGSTSDRRVERSGAKAVATGLSSDTASMSANAASRAGRSGTSVHWLGHNRAGYRCCLQRCTALGSLSYALCSACWAARRRATSAFRPAVSSVAAIP